MNVIRSKLLVPALSAAALCFTMSPPASANVVGSLFIGSVGNVTVGASTVTFTGGDQVTSPTNLTYNSGTALAVGTAGSVMNLTAGVLPVSNFLTFAGTGTLGFDLLAVGPGSANSNCAGLLIGQSCSIVAGSPFILTDTANGTSVSLSVQGTAHDALAVLSKWVGEFSVPINGLTPAQIQNLFTTNPNATLVEPYAGDFSASILGVPEPNSAMLLAAALLGIGVVWRHRPRS